MWLGVQHLAFTSEMLYNRMIGIALSFETVTGGGFMERTDFRVPADLDDLIFAGSEWTCSER